MRRTKDPGEIKTPNKGYVTYWNILSGYEEIRFLAPAHEWNELSESKEWIGFQTLLEKHQEEYLQKQQIEAEHRQESLNCKEISGQQPLCPPCKSIFQRLWDTVRELVGVH